MNTIPFKFKQANQYLLHIVFVGVGIGTANYIINGTLNWIQWSIQSLAISFIIGYPLIIIGQNKSWFRNYFKSKGTLYLFLFSVFFLVGVFATEIEHMIRSLVFQNQQFRPLSSGKMYLFNGIISLVLGYSFFQNSFLNSKSVKTVKNQDYTKDPAEGEKNRTNEFSDSNDPITTIPAKLGENIQLIPIGDIVYFEAFDNYSLVYNTTGEKRLCDYSLRFLEKRLSENFSRVHRKYIVNKNHIKQIKPHLNGRYHIAFDNGLAPITSSKKYTTIIRKLIKIT